LISHVARLSFTSQWLKIFKKDSEFDQFKRCTQGPDFSCQALAESLKENSTLKNLNLAPNEITDEGAKAWCLVRMVGKERA